MKTIGSHYLVLTSLSIGDWPDKNVEDTRADVSTPVISAIKSIRYVPHLGYSTAFPTVCDRFDDM